MARAIIAIGSAGNDGTGDTLRAGAIKINDNFAELYQDVSNLGLLVSDSAGGLNLEGISFDQRSVVFIGVDSPNSTPADNNETYLRATEPTKDNIIILPDSSGNVALTQDLPKKLTELTNDAGFVTASAAGIDSAIALTLIGDNSIDSIGVIQLIDAAYIQARENNPAAGLDSALVRQEIDLYVDSGFLRTAGETAFIDSADYYDTIAASHRDNFIPINNNTRTLGVNTTRWSELFLGTALEIDSARFIYDTSSDQLTVSKVASLKLQANNLQDSAILALGNVSGRKYTSLNADFVPSSDSALDLGASTLQWRDLQISRAIRMGDSASLRRHHSGGGIRMNLARYADADLPDDGLAGDLIIITDGDSATSGPTLAFKDSDNGNYIKFNTAQGIGGGGGF